jgi:hypothetical protein
MLLQITNAPFVLLFATALVLSSQRFVDNRAAMRAHPIYALDA